MLFSVTDLKQEKKPKGLQHKGFGLKYKITRIAQQNTFISLTLLINNQLKKRNKK